MNRRLGYMILVLTFLLAGCIAPSGGYTAASSISKDGFATDGPAMRKASGQEIKLWGYVDHGNLYGDERAREILQDWWSGKGPTATTWRFDLKAGANDATGHSFAVHVPNDAGRDALLQVFAADAKAGRPTKVFVKGKLFTFDAPTGGVLLTGLRLELQSSADVLLELPEQAK